MSTRPSSIAAARAYHSGGDVAGTAQATLAKNVGLATASIEIAASYDGQNVICTLSARGSLFIPLAEANEPPRFAGRMGVVPLMMSGDALDAFREQIAGSPTADVAQGEHANHAFALVDHRQPS